MKNLLLALLLCIGVTVFANDCGCNCTENTIDLECQYNAPVEKGCGCGCECDSCECDNVVVNPINHVGGAREPALVFEVPYGMIKTWNVTNYDHHFFFDLYEEKKEGKEGMVILIGKVPLSTCPHIEAESIVPMLIDVLGIHSEEDDEDDEDPKFNITTMPELISGECTAKRFQLSFNMNDETEILLDTHLLFKNETMYMITTGMTSDEATPEELLALTEQVMSSVNFQ